MGKKYKRVQGILTTLTIYRTPEQHRAIIQPSQPKVVALPPPKPTIQRPVVRRKALKDGSSSIGARLQDIGMLKYAEYLASPHWQDVRKRWRESTYYRGKRCCTKWCKNTEHLSLHHWTYRRLGREDLADLVLVCSDCHRAIHDLERHGMPLDKATWKVTKMKSRSPLPPPDTTAAA